MRRSQILLLLIFCAHSLVLSQVKSAKMDESEEVKATLRAMWDAIEKSNLETYAKYLHPDYSAFGEADVYLAEGKDLEVRSTAAYLKRVSGVHTEMHQPHVTVKGQTAWIAYHWTESGIDDGKRYASRGKSTRIFVKENGKWLCIHAHFTLVP